MGDLFDLRNNFKSFCSVFCVCSLIFGVCEDVEAARADPSAAAVARPQDQQQVHAVLVTPAEGSTVITRADVERCGAKNAVAVEIAAHVTEIGEGAFFDCFALEKIKMPEKLVTIERAAFLDCANLTNITIPNSVTKIGSSAFAHTGLIQVNFEPDSALQEIEHKVFLNCESLREIDIPENVVEIKAKAFQGCYNLAKVNFNAALQKISGFAFAECKALTTVDIPKEVRVIGRQAFSNCIRLRKVNFDSASNLQEIKAHAFKHCVALLVAPSIPRTNVKISPKAFEGCYFSNLRGK